MQNQMEIYALTAGVLALGLSLWSAINLRAVNKLRKTFFTGRTGQDLENTLLGLSQEINSLKNEQLHTQESLARLAQAFNFAVQKVAVVRFNPFGNDGGNFSFSLALLDALNNGVVITSMHGREQNRIYSKNIIKGKSETQLTEEEQKAITMANSKLQKTKLETLD